MTANTPAANKVFNVPELASMILSYLYDKDFNNAIAVNRCMIASPRLSVWRREVGRLLGAPYLATVQHIKANQETYARVLQTTRNIYQGKLAELITKASNPLKDSARLDDLFILGPAMTLVFRYDQYEGNIYRLHDGDLCVLHEGMPSMDCVNLYAGGSLCMGWEDELMVIRNTEDWSVMERLEITPEESSYYGNPPRPWIIHQDHVVRIHLRGRMMGNIEVRDSQGGPEPILQHPGMEGYQSKDGHFMTYSDVDVRLWNISDGAFVQRRARVSKSRLLCGILGILTIDDGRQFHSINEDRLSEAIVKLLATSFTEDTKWLSFSDRTFLYGGPQFFMILDADVQLKGAFVCEAHAEMHTLFDRCIMAITASQLVIWSPTGKELIRQDRSHQSCEFHYALDELGRIFLFYRGERGYHIRHFEVFDFASIEE